MASPHVAGALALLMSLNKKLIGDHSQLRELLKKSTLPAQSSQECGAHDQNAPNNISGFGFLNVYKAAESLKPSKSLIK